MTLNLLIGTGNTAKIGRLREILAGLPIHLLTPADVGEAPLIVEGSVSLEENAALKARVWSRMFGVCVLATDGGLDVPALGALWNPVLTARAAGPGADDRSRANHLLALAAHLQGPDRAVQRLEAVSLASPRGELVGTWLGRGIPRPLAETYEPDEVPAGFWIPGLLIFEGGRRFGQLTREEQLGADDHWRDLTSVVRTAVAQLANRAVC